MRYNDGFFFTTAAAKTIELGFVPTSVRLTNMITRVTHEASLEQAIAFNSGGIEIKAGMRLDAEDGGWGGIAAQVLVIAGSWDARPVADGTNARGWIVFEPGTFRGTSAAVSDNDPIRASDQVDIAGSVTHALVNGSLLTSVGVERPAGGGAVVAEAGITPFFGAEAASAKGFTVAATVMGAAAQLMHYQAWAPDPGSSPVEG